MHHLSEDEKRYAKNLQFKLSNILGDDLDLMKSFHYLYLRKSYHKSMDDLMKSGQNIYSGIGFLNSSILQVAQGNVLITENSIIGKQFKISLLPYVSPLKYNNSQISIFYVVFGTNKQIISII